MFKPGCTYKHSNPNASQDIHILSVLHKNEERTKMKVKYITRWNGRIQYTGKGIDGTSDTIKIKTEDFQYWSEI